MKRDLLGLQIADQFPGSINRDLIPNREQNPAIAFDRLVDFRTFITHHRRPISGRSNQAICSAVYDGGSTLFHGKTRTPQFCPAESSELAPRPRQRGSRNRRGDQDSPSEEAPFNRTIVRLRNAANVTQSRYGASNQLDAEESGASPNISATIESQRNGTSIRARSGRRKLKNRGLQSM